MKRRPTQPRSRQGRVRETAARLAEEFPDAECALNFLNPWELLAATILSAQCTDERVNKVTPALFARLPTPEDFAMAPLEEIEELIRSTGFYRNKAKSLQGAATRITELHKGEVPDTMKELVQLPGVGRKTANVLLHVAFNKPGIAVDTHVTRLSNRIGFLTQETKDAVKIEYELNDLISAREIGDFGMRLILFGRRTCKARSPLCDECVLNDYCSCAFTFTKGTTPQEAAGKRRSARATRKAQ